MAESIQEMRPVARLISSPIGIPGKVIASGIIWCCRSIAVITMSAGSRTHAIRNSADGPKAMYAKTRAPAVMASTMG